MSMLGSPKIVLLDEPSTGMDLQSKRFVLDTIEASFQEAFFLYLAIFVFLAIYRYFCLIWGNLGYFQVCLGHNRGELPGGLGQGGDLDNAQHGGGRRALLKGGHHGQGVELSLHV